MEEPQSFSLWRVGPMFRLARRLNPDDPLDVARRTAAFALVAWFPFAGMAIAAALATGRWDPLMFEISTHGRWLVAVPLLFFGEKVMDDRIALTMRYLRTSCVVPPPVEPDLRDLELRTETACDSWIAEAVLLGLAVAVSAPDVELSAGPAAAWHGLVALPLYRFLLFRWIQRWFLWTILLALISRLDLALIGLHPDRAGGLGVLVQPSRAFFAVILSIGTVVAADVAMRMHGGAAFNDNAPLLAVYVGLCVSLAALPLLPFVLTLAHAKRTGLYELGVFARAYTDAFETKWLKVPGETGLGSSDIQSLNDLAGAYDVVRQMRLFPFSTQFLVETTVVALLPVLPLYLSSLSVAQLAAGLVQIVL